MLGKGKLNSASDGHFRHRLSALGSDFREANMNLHS